jgi:uncharacterized membrane protein YhiD involved in acid resistance
MIGLDPVLVLRGLTLALLLGGIIGALHRYSVGERVERPGMWLSFVLLSATGALVMMVVGDSLSRAFSLMGALAIVRFRLQLRSPLDIAFVFLAVAVGLGAGVMAWKVVVFGTIIVTLMVFAANFMHMFEPGEVRLLRCDVVAHDANGKLVEEVIDKHSGRRSLEQARSLRFGETLSLHYRLRMRNGAKIEHLVRDLSNIEGVERVSLLMDGMQDSD